MSKIIPRALTIAGSDSGGGAGIQGDIKTFTALNVYGMSVITSITAQNTQSVIGINDIPPHFVELQIDAVLGDIGVDAVKTGMLSNKPIMLSVAKKIKQYGIEKLVVDPVMRSKGGDSLLKKEAEVALRDELLPLALIVTPNIPEAEVLSGIRVRSVEDMEQAAKQIKALGPKNVLVKGGHLDSTEEAIDVLFDGNEFHKYRAPRINTKNTHGTGCAYSAAICAGLAMGFHLLDAIEDAKEFVTQAIRNSFNLGKGHGPLNHFWKSQ
jgi:hydroxymethylpyrimidine/phosphomethylpyrimidine kinase